ncbi:DNA mismatch repair protein MutS [Candidatus Sneabacter namystus]|uniref:DNA mismatch repair protein MutS n=1 Tax=Candidatus Sneabacter namystus TaxID=2601646 RepID=A0A5C0UH02_9RICK|nr:DNA mismatch repair protein MutS [Candidatus Sneabacter namystus]QEK39368.1 DNA mismatch repair protein MutS [Candidatus Sneabacter namystus]
MNDNMCITEQFKIKYGYYDLNPLMRQYVEVKYKCQDSLLLFRLGDFYELFFEDAVTASKILGVVLTSRDKSTGEIPMCGIPFHSLDNHLCKLVKSGHTVALCEQTESPLEAKKKRGSKALVNRKIVRIFTPGTIIEESMIDTSLPNYLVCVVYDAKLRKCAICFLDFGVREIGVFEVEVAECLQELEKLQPKELIMRKGDIELDEFKEIYDIYKQKLVIYSNSYFDYLKSVRTIEDFYSVSSLSFMGEVSKFQISALGGVLSYIGLVDTNKINLPFPKLMGNDDLMRIDVSTQRNLEIVSSRTSGVSLFSILNCTLTKGGSRLLFKYLKNPSANEVVINNRLQLTQFLYLRVELLDKLRNYLNCISDLDRVLTRIFMNKMVLRDFLSLRNSLLAALKMKELIFKQCGSDIPTLLRELLCNLKVNVSVIDEITSAIQVKDLSSTSSSECFINPSYHSKLGELNEELKSAIAEQNSLRVKYIAMTGIDSIKIQHNNIIGIFLEVPVKHASKVSSYFTHRQTTVNHVRFSTAELTDLEQKMALLRQQLMSVEQLVIDNLACLVRQEEGAINSVASGVSMLDVFIAFAKKAIDENYVMPLVQKQCATMIRQGRHPVVEKVMSEKASHFVPNDCYFTDHERVFVITGPNMGGKSTFMRQVALIVLMAQIGSFVPARSAIIQVVDKLFCRIGAGDDLAMGQSTFMLEMCETAAILSHATERSLVILDEVGRGTSTYDGISIAGSCLEYISKHIGSRCLFATHYQELTQLSESLPNVVNYTLCVRESENSVSFLYSVQKGIADKSYGIHVAQIAGVPKEIVDRAKALLTILQNQGSVLNLKE